MKKEKTVEGTRLYVTRIRCVIKNNGSSFETGHYNNMGYRLLYKKNDREYIDILTGNVIPLFRDNLKTGELFISDPIPLYHYAKSLRIAERPEAVVKYANFVSEHFNKYIRNESRWYEIKDYIHKVHHENDYNENER